MIGPPPRTPVYLACGVKGMRSGMDRLATPVRQSLGNQPIRRRGYLFKDCKGRRLKDPRHDEGGLSLRVRRLEHGHFPWSMMSTRPAPRPLAWASLLLEGLEWRDRTARVATCG